LFTLDPFYGLYFALYVNFEHHTKMARRAACESALGRGCGLAAPGIGRAHVSNSYKICKRLGDFLRRVRRLP
jgi:hypothetical protein